MTVFHNISSYDGRTMFFDKAMGVSRYDVQKYPIFEKLTEKQNGFFWQPTEVECMRDAKDFKTLNRHEQHIFTSNLKRQILLDSVQGRAPIEALLPVCSLPELETWITTWSYFETIHSRSYTHIIRNIYSNPSEVFDGMLDIPEITDCARDISRYYDNLIAKKSPYSLWLCLNAINALEGIRFYVSFACSWAFAEVKKMEGNAKIIKFIARDENIHLAATQQMLKLLPKDDAIYADIKIAAEEEVVYIFNQVVEQEKAWAKYLFRTGSMIGLNEQLLCDYVEWIAHKRMTSIGLPSPYKGGTNPLPWTQKWISGSEVQVAPQETEITSYLVGGVNKDVDENTFKGMTL